MLQTKNRLHATTWWLFGIFGATLASLSYSPGFLITLIGLSFALMILFRDSTVRSRSLALYFWLAVAVVLIRVLFRIVFNQPDYLATTALALPQLNFQIFGTDASLLGPVSWVALKAALVDGLRLASIIVAIGMANTVANPRKLLRSTPTALYEVATAAAVAINLAPQLVESLHRVRKARQLRGSATGFKSFAYLVIPVLEDALNRSLELAASMDSRGFGLQQTLTARQRNFSKFTALAGVVICGLSGFALVASGLGVAWPLAGFATGIAFLVTAFRFASIHGVRTFYRIESPQVRDYLWLIAVAALGFVAFWLVG